MHSIFVLCFWYIWKWKMFERLSYFPTKMGLIEFLSKMRATLKSWVLNIQAASLCPLGIKVMDEMIYSHYISIEASFA